MYKIIFILMLAFPFFTHAIDESNITVRSDDLVDFTFDIAHGSKEGIELIFINTSDTVNNVHIYLEGAASKSLVANTKFFVDIPDDEVFLQLKDNDHNIILFCDKYSTDSDVVEWCKGDSEVSLNLKTGEEVSVYMVVDINDDETDHQARLVLRSDNKIIKEIGINYVVPDKNIAQLELNGFVLQKTNAISEFKKWLGQGFRDSYNTVASVQNIGTEKVDYSYCTIVNFVWTSKIVDFCNDAIIEYGERNEHIQEISIPRFGKTQIHETISYIDESDNAIELSSEPIEIIVIPFQVIIITLLIICFCVSCVLLYKYLTKNMFGKNKKQKNIFLELYTVKGVDNIISIAQMYDVSWKDLARANDIEPPYILISGETIKVPVKKEGKEGVHSSSNVISGSGVNSEGLVDKQKNDAQNNKSGVVDRLSGMKQSKKTNVAQSVAMGSQQNKNAAQQGTTNKKRIIHASPKNMMAKPLAEPTTGAIDIEWMIDDEDLYSEEMQAQKKSMNIRFMLISLTLITVVGVNIWWGVTWFLNNNNQEIVSVDNLIENQEKTVESDVVNIGINEDLLNEEGVVDTEVSEEKQEDEPTKDNQIEQPINIKNNKTSMRVQVLNGGATVGSAGTVTNELSGKGYKVNNAQNANNDYEGVVIYYNKDSEAEIDEIAAVVSDKYGKQKKEESDSVTSKYGADFVIVLGS